MHPKTRFLFNYYSFIVLTLLFSANICHGSDNASDSYVLAVAGPMSGPSESKGKAMLLAMQMYIDEVNAKGGIRGKKIRVLVFDDKNDKKTAKDNAEEIATQTTALAVLGNRNSSICVAAGSVYKKHQIPAVTGTATANEVTIGNDWYFRTVFNNKQQGEFIAYYIKKILKHNEISIIYDEDVYGASFLKVFEKTSNSIDIKINYEWSFSTNRSDLDSQIRDIVREISNTTNPGAIFLATHDLETVPIIKYMKDIGVELPLIGGASIGKQSFPKRFLKFPMEQQIPGYYTDDLYASTYFLYDVAGQKAQQFKKDFVKKYNKVPGAQSVSSYDVAAIVVEAIKNCDLDGDITNNRRKIRDYLAERNSILNGYHGVSGLIYFDKDGTAVRSVPMAVFKNQKLISAPVQLNQIENFKLIENLKEETDLKQTENEKHGIYKINDMFMQETKIVYTGIKFNKINNFNPEKFLYDMDFYVWFRFYGDLDTGNIVFINAEEPIKLGDPVEQQVDNNMTYLLFKVNGRFKADFVQTIYNYRQHQLGVSFRHDKLPVEKLVFVGDSLTLETSGENVISQMKNNQTLSMPSGWNVNDLIFFQEVVKGQILGEFDNLNVNKNDINSSRFNAVITIEKSNESLRGLISDKDSLNVLLISSIIFIITIILSLFNRLQRFSIYLLLVQASVSFMFLVAGEVVFLNYIVTSQTKVTPELIIKTFDVLWWITPAIFIYQLINLSIWLPIEKKAALQIPPIVKQLTMLIVYSFALFGVIAFVYNQKVISIIASSVFIIFFLVFAIRINISKILSGSAVNLESQFKIGDLIKIGDIEGKVVEITWRATKLLEIGGLTESIIPNHVVSKSVVKNHYLPEKEMSISFTINIDAEHSPDFITKVLTEALLTVDLINKTSPPKAVLKGINDKSAEYGLNFQISAFENLQQARNDVLQVVWSHLNRVGVSRASKKQSSLS